MSYWAEIDKDNNVLRVTVGDNNDPAGDEGYQWLLDNLGGIWVKASFNKKIRKNFPDCPGYKYDPVQDIFFHPELVDDEAVTE